MKTFRPKFTDNLLKFVSTVFMTSWEFKKFFKIQDYCP
jgi:hypothetical protein